MGRYLDFVVLSEEEKLKLSNGDLVEVSNDEEGFRGAWLCARLVKKQGTWYLVEYRDLVNDEYDTKQLRERVDEFHIRPSPPKQSKDQFIMYEEVDAYENNGCGPEGP